MNDIKHLAGVCIAFVLCAFVGVASAWHVGEGKFIQAEGAVVPSVNPPKEKWDRTFGGSDRDWATQSSRHRIANTSHWLHKVLRCWLL